MTIETSPLPFSLSVNSSTHWSNRPVAACGADTHEKALTGIVDFVVEGDRIVAQRWFHFSPELLEHTAAALGVPADSHGYGQ